MLDRIKSAVEYDDHFAVDDGSGRPFRVAKTALSPAMADRVRRMFAGGTVARMAVGGMVDPALMAGTVLEETPDKTTDVAPLDVVIPPLPVQVDQTLAPSVVAPVIAPVEQPAEVIAPVVAPVVEPVVAPPAPVADLVAPAAPVVAAAPAVEAPPALPESVDVAAQLGAVRQTLPAPVGVAPTEAPAIQAAVDPMAKVRIEREAAEERARRAGLELARQAVMRQQQDAVEAERLAADLANVARQHQDAKTTAEADYKRRGDDYRKDVETSRVEAGRIWGSMNLFQQVLAGLSIIAGGAAAGVTGRANAAADVIETAISRDIEQQRFDIAARQSMRLREYQTAGATLAQAAELVKADQLNLSAAKARATGALQTAAASRDEFNALAAKLDAKRAAAVETALNDMAAMQTAQVVARNAAQREALTLAGEAQRQQLAASADRRAAAQLGLAQAQLGLQRQELAEKKAERAAAIAAAAPSAAIAESGLLGYALAPTQWAALKNEKERELYVAIRQDDGSLRYRRANTSDDAKQLKGFLAAKNTAMQLLTDLDRYVPRPGGAPVDMSRVSDEGRKNRQAADAVTKQLLVQMKNIFELGALTQADIDLLQPMIPEPTAFTTADKTNAERIDKLREVFANIEEKAVNQRLVIPETR